MMARKNCVVAVWNELTPYRLHVMRRVRDELPDVRVVNAFTHSVFKNSSPWTMRVSDDLNVVFDEENRVPKVEQFVHGRAFRLATSIERVIRQEDPVFVLMHGHNDLARFLLIRRLHASSVPMVHASDANIFSEQPARGWKRPLKAAYKGYRGYLLGLMSGYMPMGVAGRAFYNLYGRQDVPYFTFPYEPDYALIRSRELDAERELRGEFRLHETRRRFLYSGRLVAGKGIETMISAFRSAAQDCPEWDLVIVGDGPLRAALEASVPVELRERVRFLGFMQMERLRSVYHVCDVLLHPSERDQWGLVINEAVAAGMAIVATDVIGAAADLVRHGVNGLVIRPRSAEAMATAIRDISRPGAADRFRQCASGVLADWQAAADPIQGFRSAVDHFARARSSAGRRSA